MFSSEIKETVYIGVSLMILSLVLGMIAVVIDIRSDFAEVRNSEITTANQLNGYRKYNKYDDKEISGVDIIELIRELKDNDIDIYVDRKNGGDEYYSTYEARSLNPELVSVDVLQAEFLPNYKYKSYLVYDFEDVRLVKGPTKLENTYSTVTGIAIIYE